MEQTLNLDFSGGSKSWFDFWHTHLDWEGERNKNWKIRKEYLQQLKDLYEKLKNELKNYPNEFQVWILIDEEDSGEDAVYIHTANPNGDNFPLSIEYQNPEIQDVKLKELIESWELAITQIECQEGKIYYLFDKGFGIPITKK